MAIEFHCPYCTATVRVGDEASGKIGRCPKCDTRLRVPTIPSQEQQTPAAASQEVEKPPVSTPPVDSNEPTAIPQLGAATPPSNPNAPVFPDFSQPAPKSNSGELPVVPVTDDPVTSKYLKRRKKKKSNIGGLVPPLLFGSVFIVIGIWYYIQSQPSYEGTLEAERLNPNQSIQIEIQGNKFQIDDKVFSQIVDEVRKRPSSVRSNLVNLRFSSGAQGLEISLRPGSEADLVKVPIAQLETVDNYYRDHFDELEDARIDELQSGLVSLAEDWTKAPEGEKNSTLPNYRNQVVYNSFVKGLGRICYAKVENAIYPCVHEDSKGNLYFLIPIGTKEFVVKERSDLKETPFFPSELSIKVEMSRPKVESAVIVPVEEAAQEISDENDSESQPGTDEMDKDETSKEPMSSDSMKKMN